MRRNASTIASHRTNTSARGRLRLAADCRFTLQKASFTGRRRQLTQLLFQLATLNQTLRFALRRMNKSYLFLLRLAWCHRCPPPQFKRGPRGFLGGCGATSDCGVAASRGFTAAWRRFAPLFFLRSRCGLRAPHASVGRGARRGANGTLSSIDSKFTLRNILTQPKECKLIFHCLHFISDHCP